MTEPRSAFPLGLVGQTLGVLALATTLILGAATWYVYQRGVTRSRSAMIEDLRRQAEDRAVREQVVFKRIERQVEHAKQMLTRRWNSGIAGMQPPPLVVDGSRRLLVADGPLALFVCASKASQRLDQQAVATAGNLLRDLGPTWCDGLPGMTIALPGHWIAGWGTTQTAQIAALQPDDPIVPDQQAQLTDRERVTWPEDVQEPESGTRSICARIGTPLQHVGTVIISQFLRVEVLLRRAMATATPGTISVVFSQSGQVLASSCETSTSNTLSDFPGPHGEALRRLAQTNRATGLVEDQLSGLWLGVTQIETPGLTMVTLLPDAVIAAQADAQANSVLMAGLLLITTQIVLAWVLLHHRITLPLRALVTAVARLTGGERGLALDSERRDEIGVLARAFVEMDRAVHLSESGLRATAETLRERDGLTRALVDSAADAVMVMQDGVVIEANPRSAVLFATTTTALLGRHFASLAPESQPDGNPSFQIFAQHCARASQGPQHFAWRALRADRSEFHAEIGLTQVELPGVVRRLAVIRDVTDRNRLEEQLRHAQKMESVGQLAGGVAHDFNNVLTAIMGSTQLLLSSEPTPRQQGLLTSILTASERAAGLVHSLLDFSRKRQPVSLQVDVHQVLRETINLLDHSVGARVTIVADLSARAKTVIGDGTQLQNVFLNLGINARDALPDGGRIRISTANTILPEPAASKLIGNPAPGSYLCISVEDSGCGIAPAILERIFDPFFTTKPIGKGTGLGLSTVYRNICDHHGGIAVASTLGVGTTFRIYLPLCDTPTATSTLTPCPETTRHRGTILVIEDEPSVRLVALELLRELGFATLEARDGQTGLEIFIANRSTIDAVVIDMEMPGLRGSECLREMLRIDPQVRAILCSGYMRDDLEFDWQASGFVAFVPKPYRLTELRHAIDFALRRGAHI